jgi:hypothetical protein
MKTIRFATGLLFPSTEVPAMKKRLTQSRYDRVMQEVRTTAQNITQNRSLNYAGDTLTEWYYVRNRLIDLSLNIILEERASEIEVMNYLLLDLCQRDLDYWQGPRYPNRPRTIIYKGQEILAGELETAQLAMGVSIAYDWCYSFLTDEVKEAVQHVLQETARPLLRNSVKFQSEHWVMNHLCVISTGLILSALVQREHDPSYMDDVDIARNGLELWVNKIDDDGSYGESVHYWSYPTNCFFFGLRALRTVLGIKLTNAHRIAKSFEWALYNQVGLYNIEGFEDPIAVAINQYDSPFLFQLESPEALLYASEFSNPLAQWYIEKFLLTNPPRPDSVHHVWHRCDGLLLALDDPSKPSQSPSEYHLSPARYFADTGFVYWRDSWKNCGELGGDTVFALQSGGGGRSRSHEHFDKNSISLFAKGEYFLIDPGHSCYRGESHAVYDTATKSHNTLTIDGADQSLSFVERGMLHDEAKEFISYNNQAHIVGRNFQDDVLFIASEAKYCYAPELRQYTRRVWYIRDCCFLIWDRIDISNIEGKAQMGFNVNNYDGNTRINVLENQILIQRPLADLQFEWVYPHAMGVEMVPAKLHYAYHIFSDQAVEGKFGSAIRLELQLNQDERAFDLIYALYPKEKQEQALSIEVEDVGKKSADGLLDNIMFSIHCNAHTYTFDIVDEEVDLLRDGNKMYKY